MMPQSTKQRSELRVTVCEERATWDDYVNNRPDASNYHSWDWRDTLKEAFGHKAYYLTGVRDGNVSGILPLVLVRSRLFGSSLVSMPFSSYGGVLADSPEVCQSLLAEAEKLGRELDVKHIELRQSGNTVPTGWQEVISKVTMEVPLPATVDEFWASLGTKMRNNVKRAKSRRFEIEWCGMEALPDFYRMFAENMRNLGTPVYSYKWFECICKQHEVRIITLRDAGRCVASGFVMPYRGIVELPWSASTFESRKRNSHVMLFWSVMEWGIQNGYRVVDLGRCTPSGGNYEFKRHWPCVEKALPWYYWTSSGQFVKQVRVDNPRFALAIQAWKRLPLWVANAVGPRIVRGIP